MPEKRLLEPIEERVSLNNSQFSEYCRFLRTKYNPNKRVLFVQIPQLILKSFNAQVAKKKGYYIFPPVGLQYLYEALKLRGLDIKILDLNFLLLKKVFQDYTFDYIKWPIIFKEYLDNFNPSIVGISCMYDLGIQPLLQILNLLKEEDKRIVIVGGVIPTFEWENLIHRDLCHFVVRGEGENKINYIFDYLTDGNRDSKICPDIGYKYRNDILKTCADKDIVSVNTDLIDSYSQVDIQEYYKYGSLNPFSRMAGIDESAFAAIQMSRGCRAVCTFCSVRSFQGQGVRKRPIDKVLAEMEFLINSRGVRHFEWLDDDPLFFKDDFKAVLQEIIRRKWKITWSANNGLIATSIDKELMGLMRDSGCIGFKIGIETGNPEMLKKIKKPATLDTFRRVAKICANFHEIFVGGNFMLGFPGEKFSQMLDSFKFYLELNLDWGAFTMCQAIRGATAFSDFQDYFDTQIDSGGENVKNFIPTRESRMGQLGTQNNILKNLDVFKIDPDCVPSNEQIKEIWFTFNLIGNYINNKNLRQAGRPEKFIAWVEMAQVAYPTNAYMSLFLALAYLIKDQREKSKDYYDKALLCYQDAYWRERFISFHLDEIVNNFPQTKLEVFQALENLSRFVATSLSTVNH